MPIPNPKKKETRDEFISRCAKKLAEEDPERSEDERLAICFDKWREKK